MKTGPKPRNSGKLNCKRGHSLPLDAPNYGAGRQCSICAKDVRKRHYEKHSETIRAKHRQRYYAVEVFNNAGTR